MSWLRQRWTAPLLALVLLGTLGIAVARRATGGDRSAPPPRIRTEQGELGVELARIDFEEWRAAFRAWRLPDPPNFDRVDVVPVRVALDAAQRWAQQGDGDALGALGCVYLALEHRAEAAECFAAAAELGSQRERWLYLLGAACHRLQWLDGATHALELARTLDPKQALTHARLGDIYLGFARVPDALASFETALELQPDLSIAAVGRARALVEVGDLAQARLVAESAVKAQPRDFAAHRALADVLARLGKSQEAAREARVAEELPRYQGWATFDPRVREASRVSRVQSFLMLDADNAMQSGDLRAATAACEELVARRPLDASLHAALGQLAASAGDMAKARTRIDRALELSPDSIEYLLAKAEIEIAASNASGAVPLAESAVRKLPENAGCRQMLGRALYVMGRQQEGLVELRRAVELAPDDVEHRAMLLESLQLAELSDAVEALLVESRDRPATREWALQMFAQRAAAAKASKP